MTTSLKKLNDAAESLFAKKKDSVRLTFNLNADKVAEKLRIRNLIRPLLNNPEAEEHQIANYGFVHLGFRRGHVVFYTDTTHLREALQTINEFLDTTEAPRVLSDNLPAVVVEFKNPDAPRVQQWLEESKKDKLLVPVGRRTVKSAFGQAYTLAH